MSVSCNISSLTMNLSRLSQRGIHSAPLAYMLFTMTSTKKDSFKWKNVVNFFVLAATNKPFFFEYVNKSQMLSIKSLRNFSN